MFENAPSRSLRASATVIRCFVATVISLFAAHSACAKDVRALDLSGCVKEGGRVSCPNIAPPAMIVLSLEQFDALQNAKPLSPKEFDGAKKEFTDP
jgi:hypothetical protein